MLQGAAGVNLAGAGAGASSSAGGSGSAGAGGSGARANATVRMPGLLRWLHAAGVYDTSKRELCGSSGRMITLMFYFDDAHNRDDAPARVEAGWGCRGAQKAWRLARLAAACAAACQGRARPRWDLGPRQAAMSFAAQKTQTSALEERTGPIAPAGVNSMATTRLGLVQATQDNEERGRDDCDRELPPSPAAHLVAAAARTKEDIKARVYSPRHAAAPPQFEVGGAGAARLVRWDDAEFEAALAQLRPRPSPKEPHKLPRGDAQHAEVLELLRQSADFQAAAAVWRAGRGTGGGAWAGPGPSALAWLQATGDALAEGVTERVLRRKKGCSVETAALTALSEVGQSIDHRAVLEELGLLPDKFITTRHVMATACNGDVAAARELQERELRLNYAGAVLHVKRVKLEGVIRDSGLGEDEWLDEFEAERSARREEKAERQRARKAKKAEKARLKAERARARARRRSRLAAVLNAMVGRIRW
ncbi:MAG: hypothetical protein J3K34DRAFT_483025 [Monoraphidium minutum]|nr:MAG: hypothetical protein J3K34DRAFT_483025 [Monoraphidium minutum]